MSKFNYIDMRIHRFFLLGILFPIFWFSCGRSSNEPTINPLVTKKLDLMYSLCLKDFAYVKQHMQSLHFYLQDSIPVRTYYSDGTSVITTVNYIFAQNKQSNDYYYFEIPVDTNIVSVVGFNSESRSHPTDSVAVMHTLIDEVTSYKLWSDISIEKLTKNENTDAEQSEVSSIEEAKQLFYTDNSDYLELQINYIYEEQYACNLFIWIEQTTQLDEWGFSLVVKDRTDSL